ncbi:hypothetical protein FRX31_004395 [Thalictrum thalictroides]|uniref:Uncharacterized protein n=1 Tax=Thalictrum thalictroides TaxID=46969 RepID=A0A7J6XAR4_THATH|nr:hypothetical protein FRX31_004395 [Thalictrum thalictroides]
MIFNFIQRRAGQSIFDASASASICLIKEYYSPFVVMLKSCFTASRTEDTSCLSPRAAFLLDKISSRVSFAFWSKAVRSLGESFVIALPESITSSARFCSLFYGERDLMKSWFTSEENGAGFPL